MSHLLKNISLRTKTALIVFFSIISIGSMIYLASRAVLLPSYAAIERDEVIGNLERAKGGIMNRVNELDIKLRDWAQWDDSYAYVQSLTPVFEESNLQDLTLFSLEINAIIYFDLSGKTVFAKAVDLTREQRIAPETIIAAITTETDIIPRVNLGNAVSGILSVSGEPALIAAQPILRSSKTGPVVGTIVFIRFLDAPAIAKLEEFTRLSLDLVPYNNTTFPEDFALARTIISRETPYAVRALPDGSIGGYATLDDISGRHVSLLRITMPRSVYNQGETSFRIFMLLGSLATLGVGVILLLLLEYFVIARFARLNKEISAIGTAHNITARVTEGTGDEIGQLAKAINTTLTELSLAQEKELGSRAMEQIATEKLRERVKEVERLNELMVNRELRMAELKTENNNLRERLKTLEKATSNSPANGA